MASIACNGCRECCKGPNRELQISQTDATAYQSYRVFNSEGVRYFLARKVNEDCYYLDDDGCTIYDTRPAVCRTYDCRDHIVSGNAHERILVEARMRV